MSRIAPLLAVVLLSACAGGLFGGSEDPPGGRNSGSEVRAVLESGVTAFNRHELNRVMGQFGADIQVATGDTVVVGFSAVRAWMGDAMGRAPDARLEIEDFDARRVGDDTVVVQYRWRLIPAADLPSIQGAAGGRYVLRGGDWEGVLAWLIGPDGPTHPDIRPARSTMVSP